MEVDDEREGRVRGAVGGRVEGGFDLARRRGYGDAVRSDASFFDRLGWRDGETEGSTVGVVDFVWDLIDSKTICWECRLDGLPVC